MHPHIEELKEIALDMIKNKDNYVYLDVLILNCNPKLKLILMKKELRNTQYNFLNCLNYGPKCLSL